MAASPPAARGRIYISYRREETAYPAAWLYHRLGDHFGVGQVLKDVDSIEPGDDFVEVIGSAVGSCDVLLALIGAQWLTITDQDGRRRLDNPDDFVRLEIEAALTAGVLVIPILVEGASMPHADELPKSLARLARRQARELSLTRFDTDSGRLLRVLERVLADVQGDLTGTVAGTEQEKARPAAEEPATPMASEPELAHRRLESEPLSRPPRVLRRRSLGLRLPRRRSRARRVEPTGEPVRRGQAESQDRVSFTAGYPGMVTPRIWYSLSVYVHLDSLQAQVDRRIAEESWRFGQRPTGSRAPAIRPLPKGTRLRIRPEVPGVVFNPPSQEVRLLESLHQVAFRLQGLSHTAGRTTLGAVEVYADELPVARVPLSIHVRGAGEHQEHDDGQATTRARPFESVFASYAHQDDHLVQAVAETYRALGIVVFMDKVSLGGGGNWRQELAGLIEEADLFQLFWSEAASRSPEVAVEWQHALSLQDHKGERFIRPVYWTIPWPPSPPQLAHLQFSPFDPGVLSRIAGGRRGVS